MKSNLHIGLIIVIIAISLFSHEAKASGLSNDFPAPLPHFNPRDYGAKGDGVAFDTEAIQQAIQACAGSGGSVIIPPGNYRIRPITLFARMTFHLVKGATLIGSADLADYPVLLPAKPGCSAICRSLIYAVNADGLRIEGDGEINGQCKEMNMPQTLRFGGGTEKERPSLLRIFHSSDVAIRGVTFRDPCMWTQIYFDCERLLIDGIKVEAPANCSNLDGMDIADSRDVVIRNCDIRSEDDSICLKSFGVGGLKNILIENNNICCYNANALKIGSATVGPISNVTIKNNTITHAKYAGIAIESVDGSVVKEVNVDNVTMHNVSQPIFIRLGKRGKINGSIDGVVIQRVYADDCLDNNHPSCTISGTPDSRVKNVLLKDCVINMPGGFKKLPPLPHPKDDGYPQSNMFGDPPAFGFFVRYADSVTFKNVKVSCKLSDVRPSVLFPDSSVTISH